MKARTRAELWLFLTTFAWAATFVITKGGLEHASPVLLTAVRFAVATLVFLPFAWTALRGATRAGLRRGAVLGAILAFGFITQTVGLALTTASKSAFITGMLVVLTPLAALALGGRRPHLGNVLGIGVVTVGLYLLTSPEGSALNAGDLLTLGCAFGWAFYIVLLDRWTREHDARLLTLAQFATAMLLCAVAAPLLEAPRFSWTGELAGALAYLALVATVGALWLQTRYQRDSTPTRCALIFSLEPVLAALLAFVVRGEVLGASGVLGGALIVAGVLFSQLSERLFSRRSAERRRIAP